LRRVSLRKSTKVWIACFAVSIAVTATMRSVRGELGCVGVVTAIAAFVSGIVLLCMGVAALFRATMRRLTLRLAFSYFLIGIVPIPLLAMLLFCAAYVLAHQFVATRVRREVTTITRELAGRPNLPVVRVSGETVVSSGAGWIREGEKAPWAKSVTESRPVLEAAQRIWMIEPAPSSSPGTFVLVPVSDNPEFVQRLADRTGYVVWIAQEHAKRKRDGWQMDSGSTVDAGPRRRRRSAVRVP
jgi:hypothetical protein